ncbi:MAG: MarR family winged helix-turn-helix transcriptional regulator [Gammaproteobacteria bacterium]
MSQLHHVKKSNEALRASASKQSLRAWLYLLQCTKRLEQKMSNRFRRNNNTSLSRFDVLANLDHAGGNELSTSQLADRLLSSKGNITRLLDRMEKDALIVRKASLEDRRVSTICLSKKGAELFSRMAREHEIWAHEILGILSASEVAQLINILKTIKGKLSRWE